MVNKVRPDDNLLDAVTEGLDAASVPKPLEGVGIEIRSDRHKMAPELDNKAQSAGDKFEDE